MDKDKAKTQIKTQGISTGRKTKTYVLSAVVYIPYETDPLREKKLEELKRIKELYELLRRNCRKTYFKRTGLFGVDVIFEECTVDLLPEKGDLYSLTDTLTYHLFSEN